MPTYAQLTATATLSAKVPNYLYPETVVGAATLTANLTTVKDDLKPSFRLGGGVDLFLPVNWTTDPDGNVFYRLVVTDKSGYAYAELETAVIETATWAVNETGSLSFVLPANDPKIAECLLPEREVQLWRGTQMIEWYVLVKAATSGGTVQFQCQTVDWYFSRRILGEVPKVNMLKNGGFENGVLNWDYKALPTSSVKGAPLHHSGDATEQPVLSGERSLELESAQARQRATFANDDWYVGDSAVLTTQAENDITAILDATGSWSGTISARVYDDNTGDRKASLKRAQDRCDAIADFVLDYWDGFRVKTTAYGPRRPKYTNSTPAGRTSNRRTVMTYRTTAGSERGHKQCAEQKVIYRNPARSNRKVKATLSGWVYLEDASGYAAHQWGVVFERQSFRSQHRNQAWADAGYKRVLGRKVFSFSKATPTGKWINVSLTLPVPPTGKKNYLVARLFPPDGTAYFDDFWLTLDEGLHYTDVEQADIMRDLIDHAQDETAGKSDLNITYDIADTGILRTREYLFSDRTVIYELLAEFSSFGDGMEWRIITTPDSRILTTGYPRIGQDTDVVLSTDSNIAEYTVDVDATAVSTTVVVLHPEGEGSGRDERSVMDSSLTGGLVLEKVYEGTPGGSLSSLQKQAERGLARYSRPVVIPNVTMNPNATSELLGKVSPGDRVTTLIEDNLADVETAGRYRITGFSLDVKNDQLSFDLYPEDDAIEPLVPFDSDGWKYLSQAQGPITGSSNTRPVESNPEYAGVSYNDSGWATGQAPFGWDQDGSTIQLVRWTPVNTTIPDQHEVWLRRTVNCTANMVIRFKVDSFAYVYVNGTLVTDGHVQGFDRRGRFLRGPIQVPQALLDPSGVQTVAIHVQDELAEYNGFRTDFLLADLAVWGTYDPLTL